MRVLPIALAGLFSFFMSEISGATDPPDSALQRYVEEPTSYSVQVEILREITNRKSANIKPHVSFWLDQLGTIHSQTGMGARWTDDNGYTPQALKILDAIEKAAAWGLDPSAYGVPDYSSVGLDNVKRAQMDVSMSLTLLKYASHARGGRLDPSQLSLWFDRRAGEVDAIGLLARFAETSDPVLEVEKLHPQHEQFKLLREAYLAIRSPQGLEIKRNGPLIIPDAEKIHPGDRHQQIPLIRRRLGLAAEKTDILLYDDKLRVAIQSFMRKHGWKRKRIIDNRVRKVLNRQARKAAKNNGPKITEKLVRVNMEKWRWMPRDLGSLHIFNNLPSFETRVVRDDTTIHSERIIVGKTQMQTPVFSDEMTHIVFKPEWGVPSSIKIKSLLPRLLGGDYGVLARRGMKIKFDNGYVKHPSRYNWSRTDIRRIPIVMGPGPSNPLGRVKFIFPNHHSVYMHDTPDKYLFKKSTRTFSHGCIRVRNPSRLAEVLLDEMSGWDEEKVASLMTRKADANNKVELPSAIPVHNAYFTLIIDPATGEMTSLKDIYGHDKRILAALGGKSVEAIARSDPARRHQKEIERLAKASPSYARRQTRRRTKRRVFQRPGAAAPYWFFAKPKPKVKKAKKVVRFRRGKRPKRSPWTMNAYQRF